MRYRVVTGTTVGILMTRVQTFLNEGWALQGGIAVDSAGEYLQALTADFSFDQEMVLEMRRQMRHTENPDAMS